MRDLTTVNKFVKAFIPDADHVISTNSNEEPGETVGDKAVRFDLVVKTQSGKIVNVEMQRASQKFYVHRALFYTSRLISRQGFAGKDENNDPWDWNLSKFYHVALLDFSLDKLDGLPSIHKSQGEKVVEVILASRTPQSHLSDASKLDLINFFFISLPSFHEELQDEVAKFMWLFNHLSTDSDIPDVIKNDAEFRKILLALKTEKLTDTERNSYEAELNRLRDEHDELLTAKQEGIELGKQEGIELGKQEGIELGKQEGIELGKQVGKQVGEEGVILKLTEKQLRNGKSPQEIQEFLLDTEISQELINKAFSKLNLKTD